MAERRRYLGACFALAALLLSPALSRGSETAPASGTPQAAFIAYLGGSDADEVRDVAVDAEGNLYVTGGTGSPNFPTTPGAFQTRFSHETAATGQLRGRTAPADAFVVKLEPSGRVIWASYLGGPGHDRAYAIDVDAEGYVYVAGRAGPAFPVTGGAFQTLFRGGQESAAYGPQDGFVCKLQPDGSAPVFCSYFGTTDPLPVRDVAVDGAGNVYIASGRTSGAYPADVAGAFRDRPRGGSDAVVAKIAPDGSRLLWATHLGGAQDESHENSIDLDAEGNPTALFTTRSPEIATRGAFDVSHGGGQDLFVARLAANTGALVWGSYLGGREDESSETHELAVGAAGEVTVAMATRSPDLPTSSGAFQRAFAGGRNDIFVARLSADGSRLLAGSYLGGSEGERNEGVAVDAEGRVYLAGSTSSPNFPLTDSTLRPAGAADRDAVAVVLSPDLRRLEFSTRLGGSGKDVGRAVGVDAAGAAFLVAGETDSRDLPVRPERNSAFGGGKLDGALWLFSVPGRAAPASAP